MYLARYSPFFALFSFYRILMETYRQEIIIAIASGIFLAILFTVYLYSQARRKAEQVLTGAANTLEGHIAALSSEMELQKCSFNAELDDLKGSVLKAQKENDALKGGMEALKRSMAGCSVAGLKGQLDTQGAGIDWLKATILTHQGELVGFKKEIEGPSKITLQGDISRILAWLGTNPYLPNQATAHARQPPARAFHGRGIHLATRHRDLYEAAMRKEIETACLNG
jgi:hypothetical protein